MKKKSRDEYRSRCPINIGLELFGDRWSLLIVRDLLFKGTDHFNGFLESQEKIATNILADRLVKLEAAGILERRPDSQDARRVRYRLSEKGYALAPVLIEIILWADAHEDTAAPPDLIAAMRGNRKRFIASLRKR
jgi:DNA-binding HxlR family transcriptional regulator